MPTRPKLALICGNGLSISRVRSAGLALDPSRPLRWNVGTPSRSSKLIDDLPALKAWLSVHDPDRTKDDFRDLIIPFTSQLDPTAPVPKGLPDGEESVMFDLGHYLTVAYSWFQVQLDYHAMSGWEWVDWCKRNRGRIQAVLSWNYDLVVERLLHRAGLRYRYAGISSPVLGPKKALGRRPALIAKPHGSCNFAPEGFSLSSVGDAGDPTEPMTYPRLLHVSGYDGAIRVLPKSELFSIRQVADIVLPGEQNRFRNYLTWVERTWSEFLTASSSATELVIVGFRMAEPDREEFEKMLSALKSVREITVVDPNPNPVLLELLEHRARVQAVTTPPP